VRDAEDFNPAPAASTADGKEATSAEEPAATQVSPPLEQALLLLNRMKSEFNVAPDNITLVTLMSVCLRSRRLSYALRAYSQAKAEMAQNRALQLDKENYYELVNLCAKKGQWRRGLDIVKDMENAGLTPSVRIYNSFLRNFDPVLNVRTACHSCSSSCDVLILRLMHTNNQRTRTHTHTHSAKTQRRWCD
jgi:pentatricopeptide repeat protein